MTTYRLFTLLTLVFALQTAHYGEHVTQMIQIYSLDITPPAARGLLGSVFDFEWVHFLYNVGLEIVLIGLWLGYRYIGKATSSSALYRGIQILIGLAVFQGYHSIEHIAKLFQYLFIPIYASGLPATPGILPSLTGWPIFLVHFWLNTIVWVALILVLWQLRSNVGAQTPDGQIPQQATVSGKY